LPRGPRLVCERPPQAALTALAGCRLLPLPEPSPRVREAPRCGRRPAFRPSPWGESHRGPLCACLGLPCLVLAAASAWPSGTSRRLRALRQQGRSLPCSPTPPRPGSLTGSGQRWTGSPRGLAASTRRLKTRRPSATVFLSLDSSAVVYLFC
jgi:hypothetical protein